MIRSSRHAQQRAAQMTAPLQGKQPTAKQQAAITRMKQRMVGVVQEELAWDKLEPIYVRLYQESFSEEEVKDIVAFYKTNIVNAALIMG